MCKNHPNTSLFASLASIVLHSFSFVNKHEYLSLSGAIGTIKAVISEVSDDSNQALGIAMIGLAWGVGIIIGPAVSGALSDPIGQYNLTVKSKLIN